MAKDKIMADPVAVTIKPLAKTGTDLACSIVGNAVDGGTLILGKGKPHRLTFHLVPGRVPGISFLGNDAVCSTMQAVCPGAGDYTTQFPSGCASVPNGTTLIVKWDPIIVNG
jgi:hypothetical protein